MILIHGIPQDPCVYTGGNFCGAGGLGPVADGAADDGHSVHNGMGDGLIASVQQIGDSRPGPDARADRAAIGGETTNAASLYNKCSTSYDFSGLV